MTLSLQSCPPQLMNVNLISMQDSGAAAAMVAAMNAQVRAAPGGALPPTLLPVHHPNPAPGPSGPCLGSFSALPNVIWMSSPFPPPSPGAAASPMSLSMLGPMHLVSPSASLCSSPTCTSASTSFAPASPSASVTASASASACICHARQVAASLSPSSPSSSSFLKPRATAAVLPPEVINQDRNRDQDQEKAMMVRIISSEARVRGEGGDKVPPIAQQACAREQDATLSDDGDDEVMEDASADTAPPPGGSPSSSSLPLPSSKLFRAKWSASEDARVLALVHKHGHNWRDIALELKSGRTGKQIRERWKNQLRAGIKKGKWTASDLRLFSNLLLRHGRKWARIALEMGRSENSVKNYFHQTFSKSEECKKIMHTEESRVVKTE